MNDLNLISIFDILDILVQIEEVIMGQVLTLQACILKAMKEIVQNIDTITKWRGNVLPYLSRLVITGGLSTIEDTPLDTPNTRDVKSFMTADRCESRPNLELGHQLQRKPNAYRRARLRDQGGGE